MLKTVKNRLFGTIEGSDISVDLFSVEENNGELTISYADSPLFFSVIQEEGNFTLYKYKYTQFNENFPLQEKYGHSKIEVIEGNLLNWIYEEIIPFQEEMDAPDLWEQHMNFIDAFPSPSPPDDDYEVFIDDEKVQLKASVDELQELIIEKFQPLEEQLNEISERLDYLSKAVDRLPPYDWRALAITTTWDIGVLMGLNPDSFRMISEFLSHHFSNVIGLLP